MCPIETFCSCVCRVLAIIEDYMMVRYVYLPRGSDTWPFLKRWWIVVAKLNENIVCYLFMRSLWWKLYDKSLMFKFVDVIIIYMMLLFPYFVFIDTSLSKHVEMFFILVFAWEQARSKLGGVDTSILHHVFLLLFTMFLCIIMLYGVIPMPVSLIICKVYTKRENAGNWNSRLKKATSELPILHISKWAKNLQRIILQYMKNIGANNYRRGPTRWAQSIWVCQGAQARPGGLCPPRPTSGAHLLVCKSFWPRKSKGWLSGRSAAVSRRNLGRSTFALRRSDSAGGTSLPEGEIIVIIITNNSPILGMAMFINIFIAPTPLKP